ncbi:hypothetical protein ABFS82_13G001000 [Erythranthe guttata]|uniref:Uncharacterized protein n=1 Tax=Erythranthe guttata TaxID=4155 RepID=A0A022RUV9_ERYGU|nr:PREDICTED: uncharacterized protein LOC105951882 [Erythranthe guttata]EYU42730.1 hypothetical protein MIMGU_mgv1a015082mg [Erythranthe guttata]|eukprot:XP_012830805.1 PREDICTED: uncharacterized protein LOC105951882 [Erythranthe guttata]
MAAARAIISSSSGGCCGDKDQVFVAAVPLRAAKGPAQLVMSTAAYSLNLQHFMVIIKPSSSNNQQAEGGGMMVYDFQPEEPESIWVAASALSGAQVSGVILVRKLKKLPNRKCWFISYAKQNDTHAAATIFNQNWDTKLTIGHHDCRHYSQGLVEYLTAQKLVLDHLN